jgi:hypothetical protein
LSCLFRSALNRALHSNVDVRLVFSSQNSCLIIAMVSFVPLGVSSCCVLIQLVLLDAVNRNKVSIHSLPFILFFTHYMFRPLRAILRWDIQLVIWRTILIQRIRCTYAIHVIKLNIKFFFIFNLITCIRTRSWNTDDNK